MKSDNPHSSLGDHDDSAHGASAQSPTSVAVRSDAPDVVPVSPRYRVLETIGYGGLGTVYRARDERTGAVVALKVLHVSTKLLEQARPSFEREYHTLRQLAHPSIIEVYDYGLDDEQRPYYTMELLSGQDLRELAPLPWREVCELAMPVASSLAVLHSRGLVHGDVSARNVRCTADGCAKLFDFGAMGPMGVALDRTGTPPYLAPEAAQGQPRDARSDLYSFGALLYVMLTGSHAYPARTVANLSECWLEVPETPHQLDTDVPEALSNMVMALLSLDPGGRPNTAAEVMARLSGIAGLPLQEDPAVLRAYLATPKLVAREEALSHVRELLARARHGRGGGLCIEAPSGMGRTRLLDACVIEAQLADTIALRARMNDGGGGEFACARTLVGQLREALPEEQFRSGEWIDLAALPRPELQAKLRSVFVAASAEQPLMLLVDDYHAIDEASAALLATLADDAQQQRLVVAVTAPSDAAHAAPMAWEVLSRGATRVVLEPLTHAQSEQLLTSIFGDVPHARLLSARLHDASEGNPRALMELAEQLVRTGVVHYEAGHWQLPDTLEELTPASVLDHGRTRIGALSPAARTLARVLALAPDLTFDYAECAALSGAKGDFLFAALNELADARIVTRMESSLRLTHDGYGNLLRRGVTDERAAHARLARVLDGRGALSRAAVHWMAADEPVRAIAHLIAVAQQSLRSGGAEVEASLLLRASEGYRETLVEAIEATGDPDQRMLLRLLVVEMGVHAGPELLKRHLPPLLERLSRDCGLADYHVLEGDDRLQRAFAAAQLRYDESPARNALASPAQALGLLARVCLSAAQSAVRWFDYEVMELLPCLEPLTGIAPGLWVTQQLVSAYGHIIAGRAEQCRSCYARVLERLARPDGAGLDAAARARAEIGARAGLALVISTYGLKEVPALADQLDAVPAGQILASQVRSMYHLGRGAAGLAEHWQRRAELLEIRHAPTELSARRHLFPRLAVSVYAEDLLGIKQALGSIEELSERAPSWRAIRRFAEAAYDHVRGDRDAALRRYDAALMLAAPGRHLAWPLIVELRLELLLELGRFSEVIEEGQLALEQSEREEIPDYVVKPLAVAYANLGDHEEAAELADRDVVRWEAIGGTGLYIGRGYETRARVALLAGEREVFEHYASMCAEHFLTGNHPGLRAKYERLLDEARKRGLRDSTRPTDPSGFGADGRMLEQMLAACATARERNAKILELLLARAGVSEGAVYRIQPEGLELLASRGDMPSGMEHFLEAFLESDQELSRTLTRSLIAPEASGVLASDRGGYFPVILYNVARGTETPVGALMLPCNIGASSELTPRLLRAVAAELVAASGNQ